MGMGPIKCALGFSTMYSSPLTNRLEDHTSSMEASYRDSQLHWLTALATLHEAIDAALAGDSAGAVRHLALAQRQLASCHDRLTALGQALVALRRDLFEDDQVKTAEPLLARDGFFASLDYDGLYRQLVAEGAVLPERAFWEETVSRLRDGGMRGGGRLLERHLRDLQSDLQVFIAEVAAAGRLPLQAMAEALHSACLPVARVMTGYTRLITAFGYVALLCERANHAHEQAAARSRPAQALVAG